MSDTILVQAQAVARQLDELTALEQARAEAEDVRRTFGALRDVRTLVAVTTSTYPLVRDRFGAERNASIEANLRTLADSVRVSRETFARDRRQERQLQGPVKSQAQQLNTTLRAGWREAAEARVRPLLQLLDLVKWLPEMQSQQGAIAQLRTRLQGEVELLPQFESQVSTFDADCRALETILEEMRGLSASVKTFLAHVADGSASLDELSEEVLNWCQQGSRASAFRITFTEASE